MKILKKDIESKSIKLIVAGIKDGLDDLGNSVIQ